MNRHEVARDALVQAIAPVLSGRTWPYPPSPGEARVAPAVWIDQLEGFPSTIGERTEVWVDVFPIRVIYDGAVRAQVAGLDEIISGIQDAVAHVPGARVAGIRTETTDPDTNRRASTVSVEYTITGRSFCLPDVGGDVVHATDDVVEGAMDVTWHATILADPPPDTADTPPPSGDVELPDLVPTPEPVQE